MTRKIYIAGNWKLNLTEKETDKFLSDLLAATKNTPFNDSVKVLVHPSFTSLACSSKLLKGTKVAFGAQNCSAHKSGAYTGEISVDMISETGAQSIIIGHSERREIFKESDEDINAKFKAILAAAKLTAIVCCGESEQTREAGKTDTWVAGQIEAAFKGIEITSENIERIVIAYEPIWAIGTGKTCDSEEANRVIKVIRDKVSDLYGKSTADKISILYGGSVKASNIEELLGKSDIDGALIGGASLKIDEFSSIIESSLKLVKA